MAKLMIIFATLMAAVAIHVNAQCPVSSKVTNCSPKCIENAQCSTLGGICCPNICNYKSCILPNQFGNKNNDKYDSGKNGGAGTYCGNIKCNSFEKCEMDRSTKRMKCVRA